jgi:DNA-binding IclR family transcriptional regulator
LAAYLPLSQQNQLINSAALYAFTKNTITTKEDLAAELKTIRQCGYAIDNEEHENGVRCIAAPIFNHLEAVIAAISISLPADRLPLPLEGNPITSEVIRIANQISAELGCLSKIPQ